MVRKTEPPADMTLLAMHESGKQRIYRRKDDGALIEVTYYSGDGPGAHRGRMQVLIHEERLAAVRTYPTWIVLEEVYGNATPRSLA